MKRAIIVALSGIAYFVVSLALMVPLRMKPVANYNLFFMPGMSIVLLFLFYKLCTVTRESRAYVYGFFAAIVMWQVLGETASIRVPEGIIQQFSNVNIKLIGGWPYVLAGWILLHIAWLTEALSKKICFFLLMFLGIWTFELYMENYSSMVPLDMMPRIAYVLLVVFAVASVVILYAARKSTTPEKQTVMGGLLYLTLSIVLMCSGQWQKPQSFYLKYEAPAIEHEIKELQEELEHIKMLRRQFEPVNKQPLEPNTGRELKKEQE